MQKPIYLFSISSHPDAISINSLEIKFLKPDINFSDYDYMIITSKQAVNALTQYETSKFLDKKALCISEQSALSYKKINGKILTVGAGYGDDLINILQKYPKNTKWLYLRAKKIASNFTTICNKNGYNIAEKIVYESDCSSDILKSSATKGAILIFTSPSSVKCYMKNNTISQFDTIIVIGHSTAKVLPKNVNYHVANETNIQNCIDLAHSL